MTSWSKLHELYPDLGIQTRVVQQTISPYNAWTFPKGRKGVWRSQPSMKWVMAGLNIFDYKKTRKVPNPREGELIQLFQRYKSHVYVLTCKINRFFKNDYDTVDDAIAVGNDRSIYSKSCGRAKLTLMKFEVKPYTTHENTPPVRRKRSLLDG